MTSQDRPSNADQPAEGSPVSQTQQLSATPAPARTTPMPAMPRGKTIISKESMVTHIIGVAAHCQSLVDQARDLIKRSTPRVTSRLSSKAKPNGRCKGLSVNFFILRLQELQEAELAPPVQQLVDAYGGCLNAAAALLHDKMKHLMGNPSKRSGSTARSRVEAYMNFSGASGTEQGRTLLDTGAPATEPRDFEVYELASALGHTGIVKAEDLTVMDSCKGLQASRQLLNTAAPEAKALKHGFIADPFWSAAVRADAMKPGSAREEAIAALDAGPPDAASAKPTPLGSAARTASLLDTDAGAGAGTDSASDTSPSSSSRSASGAWRGIATRVGAAPVPSGRTPSAITPEAAETSAKEHRLPTRADTLLTPSTTRATKRPADPPVTGKRAALSLAPGTAAAVHVGEAEKTALEAAMMSLIAATAEVGVRPGDALRRTLRSPSGCRLQGPRRVSRLLLSSAVQRGLGAPGKLSGRHVQRVLCFVRPITGVDVSAHASAPATQGTQTQLSHFFTRLQQLHQEFPCDGT